VFVRINSPLLQLCGRAYTKVRLGQEFSKLARFQTSWGREFTYDIVTDRFVVQMSGQKGGHGLRFGWIQLW